MIDEQDKADALKFQETDLETKAKLVADFKKMLEDTENTDKMDELRESVGELMELVGLKPDSYTYRAALEGIRMLKRFEGLHEDEKDGKVSQMLIICLMALELDSREKEKNGK